MIPRLLPRVAETWQTLAALPHAVIILHCDKKCFAGVVVGEVRHAHMARRKGMTVESRITCARASEDVHTVPDLLQNLLHGYPEDMHMSTDEGGRKPRKLERKWLKEERSAARQGWMGRKQRMAAKAMLTKCQTLANLSAAALDGMDADNSNALDMRRRTCSKQSGSGRNAT